MARRPKKPDAPKKPKSKSGKGGGTATATQTPAANPKFQKMREILENRTGGDLSTYSDADITELYTELRQDLGYGEMSIDDAHSQLRADFGEASRFNRENTPEIDVVEQPAETKATGEKATRDTYQPIDDADVGTPETVDDEFVSSEIDLDDDVPTEEAAPQPRAAAGGDPPDDTERLERLLAASELTDKNKKADPDLGPWMRGKGANRLSEAAAEIEGFLNANGYKISSAGKITPMPEPKAKKPRSTKKKETTADVVDTTETETIDGGDELDGTADADMEDPVKKEYESIDKDPPNDPPEDPPEKPKKNRKDKGKGNKTSGEPWWKATIDEPLDRPDRIWVQQNDPGPDAPQDAKAKFLSDLDARVTAKENTANIDAAEAEREAVKTREANAQEQAKENKTKFRRRGLAGLAGAEITRELIANARRDKDEENWYTKPDMSEPIMAGLNFATGGGLPDGLSSTDRPAQQTTGRGSDSDAIIDRAMGRRVSPFSRVLEDFGPPTNAPARLPAGKPVSTEDTIRRNRPQ